MATATHESHACVPRNFELQAETELRFEVPPDCSTATITLTRGSVEIFGIELALNRAYTLAPLESSAAFTWHGATITLHAPAAALAYVASDTPMPSYLVAHAALQGQRESAKESGARGPRALVVGPHDSGKSALVRTLAAYCVKANGAAVVSDLDASGAGAAAMVPEAISLSVVTRLDLESGGLVHARAASFMLGHASPRANIPVTRAVFAAAADAVSRLLQNSPDFRHVGVLCDTCGDVERANGAQSVVVASNALGADVVFVLGAERLFASVKQLLKCERTSVVLLNKSGGVVSRDAAARAALSSRQIRAYFYGVDNRLSPFRIVVDFSSVTVLKVGGQVTVVPDSVLPVGAQSTLDPLKPAVVSFSMDLLHSVLAVSQAKNEEEVLKVPAFGYVHVVHVDMEKNVMIVLAPSTGKIPSKYLLAGSIKWIE